MSYANESQTAEGVVQKVQEGSRVFCPECGGKRVRRVERKGFMQKSVFPYFGFFPWYCRECRKYSMIRKRKGSKSSEEQYVERED